MDEREAKVRIAVTELFDIIPLDVYERVVGRIVELLPANTASAWEKAIELAETQYIKVGPSNCTGYDERAAHNDGIMKVVHALERERDKSHG